MTIEVRHMLITSTVKTDEAANPAAKPVGHAHDLEQMRVDILAECKTWFELKINERYER